MCNISILFSAICEQNCQNIFPPKYCTLLFILAPCSYLGQLSGRHLIFLELTLNTHYSNGCATEAWTVWKDMKPKILSCVKDPSVVAQKNEKNIISQSCNTWNKICTWSKEFIQRLLFSHRPNIYPFLPHKVYLDNLMQFSIPDSAGCRSHRLVSTFCTLKH